MTTMTIREKAAREWRVYRRLIRLHVASGVEYKGWWLMLIQVLFVVASDPISTVLVFSRFGPVGDWTVERILMIYALAVASFGLAETFFRGFDYFPFRMIQNGAFDRLFLRPCSLFTQVAASYFHIHRTVRPVTGLIVVAWSLGRQGIRLDVSSAGMLVLAILGGMLLYCGVFVLTSGLSVFTVRGIDWIYILTNASYQIARIPHEYLPLAMKSLFTFLMPVLVISYYPASAACGWGAPQWTGWLAFPAGCVFFALSLLIWRVGVRHYKSTGS